MKNIFYLFLILAFVSCEDYLDINDDPNRATQVEPEPLFTGALVQYSTNRVIDLGPALSTATQLWSGGGSLGAGVFTNPENYTFSIFTTGNTWRAYYREMLKNLRLAKDRAIELGDNNSVAQISIVEAFTFYSATTLWEDVPYTEATDIDLENIAINTLNPSFDEQETVLRGIIADLDEAIGLIEDDQSRFLVQGDLIYTGDMNKWRKFANSLKFRTYLTLVDRDPSVASEISKLIEDGDMIASMDDEAVFPFFSDPGNRNPFWGTLNTFAGGANFFYFAEEDMVEIMQSKNDPRLPVYFTPYPGGDSPAEITGAPSGVTNIGFNPWVLSTSDSDPNALVRPDSPDRWFSFPEQALLEAEAIVRDFANGDANERYTAGIAAAMQTRGVAQGEIDAYLSSLDDINTLSEGDALEAIGQELYVANILRPLEHFVHWRRLDVPELEVPAQAITTDIIRRLPYPPDELGANSNAPTTLPDIDDPMWFDVE